MGEGCTCHLGFPPCGYCVEGTETYQDAQELAEMLDDRELERLRESIDRIRDERAERRAAKAGVLAILTKAATPIIQPVPQPAAPVSAPPPPKPEMTPAQRHAHLVALIAGTIKQGIARAAAVKAMAIPSDPKPWKAYDAVDRKFYETSVIGPRGDGAQWDNRRGRR